MFRSSAFTIAAAFVILSVHISRTYAQTSPPAFKDLESTHWAYAALEDLRAKGILVGYPDGYFRGRRTLTRFEMAVAVDRAMKAVLAAGPEVGLRGEIGPQGPQGPRGPVGPQGPPYIAGDLVGDPVAELQRLAREFRDELRRMGTDTRAGSRRLDSLQAELTAQRQRLDRQPKVFGGFGTFVRADERPGTYIDRDGRPNGIGGPTAKVASYGNAAEVHELELGISQNLANGGRFMAAITSSNYVDYLGGSLSQVRPLVNDAPSETYLHYAVLDEPLGAPGGSATITVGRFGERVSHFTLWRPNLDSYFDNPFENDGNYYMDGARIRGRAGSLSLEAFAGKTSSVTDALNGALNLPMAGVAAGATGTTLYVNGRKPFGQPNQGQMAVDELAGVDGSVNLPWLSGGRVRLTAIDTANTGTGQAGTGFSNVAIFGSDADLKITSRYVLTGEWGKTVTGNGLFTAVNSGQDNAFDTRAAWGSGWLKLQTGYRYIDPRFYAPADWGRLGNWIDPTNVQGPLVHVGITLSRKIGADYDEEFYHAVHDESQSGGLDFRDTINRIHVNLHWHPTRAITLSGDWEGIRAQYRGLHSGIPGVGDAQVHNPENYTRVGLDYDLTTVTWLSLGYNIGEFQGKHSIFMGPNTEQNFNVLTGQVVVRF